MQHQSPAISSPSTVFLGPRASPLFNSSLDQNIDGGGGLYGGDLLRPSMIVTRETQDEDQQAPPKRLARAMESLGQAHRLIADVRSGADLILEALEAAVIRRWRENVGADEKSSNGLLAAAEATKLSIEALRTVGRELESSGILRGAQQRYEDNQPWGLQPPSVCPDGLITPYAWKRQIAGQAAASAVERTRLALKAFGEQKKRFFSVVGDNGHGSKRGRAGIKEPADDASLANVLRAIQSDAPGMAVTPFVRLEWGKRTSSMNLSKVISDPTQALASLSSQSLSPVKLEPGTSPSSGAAATTSTPSRNEKVAVLEVTISGVLRAIISLHPMGSAYPDAIAVFSPDEFGGYVHAWGVSQHKLHQKISEQGVNALHYFRRNFYASALEHLLHWIYSYRSLFTDPCTVCKRMTALDPPSDLLLPPLVRPYHLLKLPKAASVKSENPKKEGELAPFHVGCVSRDEPKGV